MLLTSPDPQPAETLALGPWLDELAAMPGAFSAMLRQALQGAASGYGHTIREICRQPVTWAGTARRLPEFRRAVVESLSGCRRVVLTGSGSSQFAGDCAAPALCAELGLSVEALGSGSILTARRAAVQGEPTLVVSLARSGDSPESSAVVELLLALEPGTRHLIVTCNPDGKLARNFAGNPRVRPVILGSQVDDRSLVMTSSFTNLALGALYLSRTERPQAFAAAADDLAAAARRLLADWPDRLARFIAGDVTRIVFLGAGCRHGAAKECALKVLEMTGGKIASMAETCLGLRHGPMCYIDERTLVVCFLSSDPLVAPYEIDLIRELHAKGLGAKRLAAGRTEALREIAGAVDVAIPYEASAGIGDPEFALLDAIVGQLLGFHRCLLEGLQPDSPSSGGIITRVVGSFPIHFPPKASS